MNFAANLKMLDAERLQQTAKATIQSNGRLSLTVEAGGRPPRVRAEEGRSLLLHHVQDLFAGDGDRLQEPAYCLRHHRHR